MSGGGERGERGGLEPDEAARRLEEFGPNRIRGAGRRSVPTLIWSQFRSPLVIILVFAAAVSLLVGSYADALIILAIVVLSTALGFTQEYRATRAVEDLIGRITLKVTVRRGGRETRIPATGIVPGDLILLSAGTLVPADGVLLESRDLYANEAVLTGESLPSEKDAGRPGQDRVYMGTSVRSGTGLMRAEETGARTRYGAISERLRLRPEATQFEAGLRQFGFLLTRVMFVFVFAVFVANVFLRKPVLDSLMFSIALAVGLSPELLPAILSVTLAKGAVRMSRRGVIVRRLNAIENLGGMTVLCSDKTGTLTTGNMVLHAATAPDGEPSPAVRSLAYLNAGLQAGIRNPLDDAILEAAGDAAVPEGCAKVDEIPYDFVRKRLTVVVRDPGPTDRLITKGAFQNVIGICDRVRSGTGTVSLSAEERARLEERFARWGCDGIRVIALATSEREPGPAYTREDERGMVFEGFLLFEDPAHPDAREALAELGRLGVAVRIITGDNRHVARAVARAVGLDGGAVVTGEELDRMSDEALWHRAERTALFAEVDPQQKERIIVALRKKGHVVGFLGDGINDAPALHAADVGISVESAVDVAKDSADIIFVEHNLKVACAGVSEGRLTFANTMKYIHTTTSANLGNMISMAVASVFLPFLPLLAHQILLNNFLSDVPAVAIGADRVDREWLDSPRRWNIREVRRFMTGFGLISSAFDGVTFLVLLLAFRASPELFRTGWFLESLLTELLILFAVRTRRGFLKSRPSPLVAVLTVLTAGFAIALPYSPLAGALGFVPLPPAALGAMLLISAAYFAVSEATKSRVFAATERAR